MLDRLTLFRRAPEVAWPSQTRVTKQPPARGDGKCDGPGVLIRRPRCRQTLPCVPVAVAAVHPEKPPIRGEYIRIVRDWSGVCRGREASALSLVRERRRSRPAKVEGGMRQRPARWDEDGLRVAAAAIVGLRSIAAGGALGDGGGHGPGLLPEGVHGGRSTENYARLYIFSSVALFGSPLGHCGGTWRGHVPPVGERLALWRRRHRTRG